MTRNEANELAKRIVNTWRTSIPFNEWADYLAALDDAERAGQVFLRLRAELEYPPTFKRYSDEYRALAAVVQLADHERPTPGRKLTREQRMAILTSNGARPSIAAGEHPPKPKSEASSRYSPEEIAAMWAAHDERMTRNGAPLRLLERPTGDSRV